MLLSLRDTRVRFLEYERTPCSPSAPWSNSGSRYVAAYIIMSTVRKREYPESACIRLVRLGHFAAHQVPFPNG